MALVQQTVPVKLGRLDTKTDSRWALAGDLVSSENLVFDSWPKLEKRAGYAQIAEADAGTQLTTFKGSQLLVGTGGEAYGYTASGLVDKGVLESLTVSSMAIRRDSYVETTPDCAVHSAGISVHTWETSAGGSQYSVFDVATGVPIVAGVSLGANSQKPKPLAVGNYVVILFYDTSLNHLRYVAIPAADPTNPTAATDFALDPSTAQVYDATVIGGQMVVAYANNGVSNRISLRYLTGQLVLSAEQIPTTAEVFDTCCAIFGDDSDRVWVAYYSGSAVKVFVYDALIANLDLTFTTVDASPGTVRNITGYVPGHPKIATLLYEATGSQPYNNLVRTATVTLAGSVSGVGVLIRSVGLASKPFSYLNRTHVLVAYESDLQSTYFLLSGSTVVAKFASSVGGGLTAKSILPEVSSTETGVYVLSYLQTTEVGVQEGAIFSQSGVMKGTLDFTQPQVSAELSDDLHLSGGILWMYDGQQVCEHNFHLYPENVSASVSGVGGSILAGTYQYVVTFEWMDAQGLVHQSSPSPAVEVTTSGSTSSVTLTIPTLRLTSKGWPISVVVWRTQANQSVLYRLTSIASPLLNSTTSNTVSYVDTAADTSIGGNEQIYSNPLNPLAELPNLAAPAPRHVWRYRNRLALIPSENSFQWVYSKAFVAGVPLEFNAQQLFQSVSQDGGPLACGIEMDEKNILFTAHRIYYVTGDGPAPNGTSSDYGQSPQNIPSDVGCDNGRSLVLTPKGVMFQSAKGIYLLGRDLSVSYVGAEVEAYNDLTITGACLVPNSRRVVFFTDGGLALVYDYFADKWTTWTNVAAADGVVYGSGLAYVKANGLLMQETPGLFTDAGAPVLLAFTTSILSFAGLSGFQRVWRLTLRGDYRSPHTLSVYVAFDNSPAPQQQALVDSSVLGAGAVGDTLLADSDDPGDGEYPQLEYVVKLLRQKCTSIQVTVRESQGGPTYGEGLSVSGLTFLVGSERGLHPVPRERSIS